MRSYRRAGIDCPVGVHYVGALDQGQPLRRLWDALDVTSLIPLERMGAEGIIDRYVFDDFEFNLPAGVDAFEENLRQSFPEEQARIEPIMADLRDIARSLAAFDIFLSPALTTLSPDRFESMGERLLRLGCSPRLTAVLAVPATLIGIPLQECPVYYYYMTLASYLLSSWRLAASGTAMAEAFASRFQSLGGRLVTGDSVEAIQVESGRTKGIVLRSGGILPGEVVIAAVHPAEVIALLPQEAVRSSYRDRVEQLENTKGLLGVNVAVDAASHRALPYNVYRLYPAEDGSLPRGIFHQLRESGQTGTNLLSMITSSGIEEWQPWGKTAPGKRGRGLIPGLGKQIPRRLGPNFRFPRRPSRKQKEKRIVGITNRIRKSPVTGWYGRSGNGGQSQRQILCAVGKKKGRRERVHNLLKGLTRASIGQDKTRTAAEGGDQRRRQKGLIVAAQTDGFFACFRRPGHVIKASGQGIDFSVRMASVDEIFTRIYRWGEKFPIPVRMDAPVFLERMRQHKRFNRPFPGHAFAAVDDKSNVDNSP